MAVVLDFRGSHIRNDQIKNLFCESFSGGPMIYGLTYFQTQAAIWIKREVRCCRRCGVAGSKRVPPWPLGWYLIKKLWWIEFLNFVACILNCWDEKVSGVTLNIYDSLHKQKIF